MKTFIDIFKTVMVAAVFLVSAVGCSDDIDYPAGSGPEGENTKLTLKINVTEATKLSRATSDSYVKSLWVGIYNASTGQRTNTQYFFTRNEDVPGHAFKTLENIECKSGNSYIVAVANYEDQTATDMRDKSTGTLAEKLEKATTWEAYCALAIEQNMASGGVDISVAEPSGELIMSGAYYESNHDAGTAPGEMKQVYISSKTAKLTGAIHLRRLWSKNTLNISAAGDIVSMELLDVEIINVPKYSWVQDRAVTAGLDGDLTTVNAGDILDSKALENSSYLTSMRFTPPSEITVKDNVYTFSFWQFENKRTGSAADYADREIEHKDAAGKNTGIYTSLCSAAAGDVNNNATYVKIHANITYKNPGSLINPDGIEVGDNAGQLPGSAASRTAEVSYIVHLGYIGKIASDFNCNRNTNYTYYITAESVGKILLEAFIENDSEHQPGAEGTVTDVTDKIETMDAHSGQFNIFLTADQVKGFTFSMRTYASGSVKSFYYNSDTDNNIPASTENDFKYYNWIELIPTGLDVGKKDSEIDKNNERIFAEYPNIVNGREGKHVYYPHELPKSGEDGQWFTVIVNEYAYERPYSYEGTIYGNKQYGDESGDNWKTYVNQPNRQAWFNVAQETSKDGESVYYKSKYALTQRSFQTYYNTSESSCETALAVEHINENFGQNIRWLGNAGASGDNGRSNLWTAVSGDPQWSSYLDVTSQQNVNAINNKVQTADTDLDLSARVYPLIKQKLMTGLTGNSGHFDTGASEQYDPQHGTDAQYINAIYACLNRNRDENGNGQIDAAELKWYLPGAGKYLRLILGRNSLSTPLMDYAQSKLYDKCGDDANTRYHYIASDGKIIWVDEGLSSSNFLNGGAWSHAPWQLRCIRNLGTNLNSPGDKEDGVDAAYNDKDYDSSTLGGVVKVKHYYGTALREPTTSPLPMHKASAPENKLARYGFEIAPRGNFANATKDREAPAQFIKTSDHTVTQAYGPSNMATYKEYSDSIAIASPCQDLNKNSGRIGWRVPNQKEIAIMMRMGILGSTAESYSWVEQSFLGFSYWTLQASQNGMGTQDGFMTCTQEHWTNFDDNKGTLGSSTEELSWNYRMVTAEPVNKIATATNWKAKYVRAVRCVRDLTAAEAEKTYSEIVNNR